MGLSIEQIKAYISQHPDKCKDKSMEEIIALIGDDDDISVAEMKEAIDTSVFGNDNSNKIGDGIEIKHKKNSDKKKENLSLEDEFNQRLKENKVNLEKAEKSNGFFGMIWSGTKNLFGIGASSNKVRKAQENEAELISQLSSSNKEKAFKELTGLDYSKENEEKFRNGEIKLKSETALDSYTEGQEMAADIGGDIVSGIAAVGFYSLAIASGPAGWAGIGLATLTAVGGGGLVKSGVKALDAAVGGRKYDSFTRDLATGAFSGALAPITGGVGGAVGRGLATKIGLKAVSLTGKEAVKTGGKSFLKTALTNPAGFQYTGGSLVKKLGAYTVEAATDGALGGGIDTAFRTAYDGGSAEEVIASAGEGALGGLVLGPAMSLGFKGAAKGSHWLFGKFKKPAKTAATDVKTKTDADTPAAPKAETNTEPKAETGTPAAHADNNGNVRNASNATHAEGGVHESLHSPIKPERKDAFGISSVLNKEQLAQTSSQLLVKKGDKFVLTAQGDVIVRQAAEQIRKTALGVEPEICKIMKEMGLATDETLSHRSKGVQSLYDKIKNALIDDKKGTMTLEEAINSVKDGVGVRTVNEVGNFASHPSVKKYLDAGDIKTARQKAVELESEYVLQGLMRYIDAKADGTNKVNLTRISNYMGEDGIPYFTERQLNRLKAYADSKGVKLPIVERVNNLSERLAAQTTDVYNPKSTTKVRGSGYTALQMNFETLDGFTYEWQYRGKKLNSFAEGEHIPYDLRTNKDIIGTNKELTRLYEPMKKLLTDKKVMTDTMYEEYNHYLTAHYEYLRLAELGFNDGMNPPKLPKGFDERLRAENLELVHEIAEKIKKNPEKEAEFLREYESRLVRNTPDNVTSESYTAAAAARAKNKSVDRYEASVRAGEKNGAQNDKYSSVVIKACKDETGEIKASLIAEAEKLQAMGISDTMIAKLINKTKKGQYESLALMISDFKKTHPDYDNNTIAGLFEIAAGKDGFINGSKFDNALKFHKETGVDVDVIAHVYKKLDEADAADVQSIKDAVKQLCDSYKKNVEYGIDFGAMRNNESLKSVIDVCFDKAGKIDENTVTLSRLLLTSNVDFSQISQILNLAKLSTDGKIYPGYKDFLTGILKDAKFFLKDNSSAKTNSHILTEVTKSIRQIKKQKTSWAAFANKGYMDFFRKAMIENPQKTNETYGQYLFRISSMLQGSKTEFGISPRFYNIAKNMSNNNYDATSIKEIVSLIRDGKILHLPGKLNALEAKISPAEKANIIQQSLKIEDGIIRQTLYFKDKTNIVRDFDINTLELKGEYSLNITKGKNRNFYRETDDTVRGLRTRVKRRNNTPYEETTVIKDPKTGEVLGVEYLTDSDIPGVFNIQYRDIKNGGITKNLSSGYRDELGNITVEKNYKSLDGTETNYNYKESPDGSYSSDYKITDETGQVILNEHRTFDVIDEHHFESTCNGKKYLIEIDEDNMLTVTNESGKTVKFDLDEFSLENMNNENFVELFKHIPGHEFFNMEAAGTKSIVKENVIDNAHYSPGANSIKLGENEQILSTLLHEFGHNKDYTLDSKSQLRNNKELVAIYEQERKNFIQAFPQLQRDYIDYFIGLDKAGDRKNRGVAESIAESNMLLNVANGKRVFRAEYLRRYFPKTIAYVAKNLNPEVYI